MTLAELERQLRIIVSEGGLADPAVESRHILRELLKIEAAQLLIRGEERVSAENAKTAKIWAERRTVGYPLAYLSGYKGFYKHRFFVEPGVLVPRPESEFVVEVALSRVKNASIVIRSMADLGCGSGCIGLSLLPELPLVNLYSIDISPIAIQLTLKNTKAMNLEERVVGIHRSVETWHPSEPLDMIVANPPYIAAGDPHVEKGVHDFEPHQALYAEQQGLAAIRSWASWSQKNLNAGGILVFEIGSGQTAQAQAIMDEFGFADFQMKRDLAGHDRVISAVRK